MITYVIIGLALVLLIYLGFEAFSAKRARAKLRHVIHVNGTRGKSTVTRMIYAGLMAGGVKAFAKTTGTLPMTLDADGKEETIRRRGGTNIREQLGIMAKAALNGAETLVAECMAISPELIRTSQRDMLKADITVITNARQDHADVMGNTVTEVAEALFNTLPKNGICFTADEDIFADMSERCLKLGSRAYLAKSDIDYGFDFSENVELALCVCEKLGVARETAMEGIKEYKRDPYALSVHTLKNGAVVINGLSINDPDSTEKAFRLPALAEKARGRKLTLLINTRKDRLFRTEQMIKMAAALKPEEVWLIGYSTEQQKNRVSKLIPGCGAVIIKTNNEMPLDKLGSNDVLYAVGNLAGGGLEFIELVKKESVRSDII